MKKSLKKIIGSVMAVAGMSTLLWLWVASETTGHGLTLGVLVSGVPVAAMAPVVSGIGLIVIGLVIFYGGEKHGSSTGVTRAGMSFPVSEDGKHYFADGSWYPVVLDPMGDQSPQFCAQWIKDQQQERQVLIDAGETVNY